MGLFAKKSKRAQRHIARINEMFAETDTCAQTEECFPVLKIIIESELGETTVQLTFEGKKLRVFASYDKELSYYGKGIAFQEFMKLNKEPGKEWKEKWNYRIDPDSQKMVFTEKYKMKYKLISTDKRFNAFFERVFRAVPSNFDMIQGKMQMRGSMHVYSLNTFQKNNVRGSMVGAMSNSK